MSKELDFSLKQNCVFFNLRWVARAVTKFYNTEMRRHGIRPAQGAILSPLQGRDSWTVAELSDWRGMERTTLMRYLWPLQRDGLVQIDEGGRGSRVEVFLTAKSRKQIEKIEPAWKSAQSAAVKTFVEKCCSALLADLEKVASALKN